MTERKRGEREGLGVNLKRIEGRMDVPRVLINCCF